MATVPDGDRGWTIAATVAFVLIALATVLAPAARPSGLLRDFDAFYCAGQAIDRGADPYRAEPLGSCERVAKPPPLISGEPGLAMPAPLPPYALAPFALLARLPYVAAALVWTLLLVVSLVVTVTSLRRVTGLPIAALAFAFVLGDGYASLALGQVAPIAIAAIALAAMLLLEGRDELAACAASVAMLEPHLGLPVCASLFWWRNRTRLPFVALCAAGVAASLAHAGGALTLEYLRQVVPAHAASEIANEKQFSLTYALYRLHVPEGLALRAGELSYALAAAAAIWLAGRIALRDRNAGAIAVIPAALAVFGGPFVHISQIAAALPAALLLYAPADGPRRRAIGPAIVALAIPWIQFANLGTVFIALSALVAAYLSMRFIDARPTTALLAGCATVCFIEVAIALVTNTPDVSSALRSHYDPRALAEASWTLYVRTMGTANAAAFDFTKLPTLAALVAIVRATFVVAVRPSEASGEPIVAAGGNGAAVSRRIALP